MSHRTPFAGNGGRRGFRDRASPASLWVTLAICAALIIVLLAVTALAAVDFRHSIEPWGLMRSWTGLALLVNLLVGRAFIACWVYAMEPSPRRAAAWIVPLMMLGAGVGLVYLLVRARKVRDFEHLFRRHERRGRRHFGATHGARVRSPQLPDSSEDAA